LGLVYETAGQLEKAAETYGKALEIAPDDRNALACSARVAVKQDEAPDRIHWLLEQVVMHDDRAEWLNWAKELLATRYRLDAPQELYRDRPLTQPFPGYQYQSLDIGSPEQLPIDQAPIIEQPDQTPSSSRQLKEPTIEPLPVPSPKAPGGPLQEASSFNLSRAGLPTVPSEIIFPSKIPYVQTPISANSGMVVPASGEVRLP
jgi:hypothetical protein